MNSKSFFLLQVYLLLFSAQLYSQSHAVGFQSYFIKDHSRITEGLAYRPILVNIWYPAQEDKNKDYISIKQMNTLPKSDTTTSKFSEQYYKYVLENLDYTLFARMDNSDSLWKESELTRYLNIKTAAKWGVTPIKDKKFPLVIIHQGLGGTVEENYVLCDLLAQNGFVVVGSTFFDKLDYMSPGNFNFSRQDVSMLINEMTNHNFVDLSKIYYVGHSYGAQAGFTIISQDRCPIDLFVSLDTTFDHHDDKELDEMWSYLMPTIKEGYSKVRIPSYHFISDREGNNYNVPKRHIYSNRKLVTTKKYITHNSFISIGYHEAKMIKEKYPDYDIDTSYYHQINKTILNILTHGEVDMEKTVIDTNIFKVEYLEAFKPIEKMSEYEPLIQKNGLDSTLRFVYYINQIDKSTLNELGYLTEYYLKNGDLVTAEKISDFFSEKNPEYWNSHFTKAKVLVAKNQKEDAKPFITRAYGATKNWYNAMIIQDYCTENEITFKKGE